MGSIEPMLSWSALTITDESTWLHSWCTLRAAFRHQRQRPCMDHTRWLKPMASRKREKLTDEFPALGADSDPVTPETVTWPIVGLLPGGPGLGRQDAPN
jgi:hypothetical protein